MTTSHPAPGLTADQHWLDRAAALSVRGHGGAEPNPLVGCIVLDRAGNLVGCGFHRRCGEAHAEVAALTAAGKLARGGTLYVSLEPCTHHGRTPPCCDAIVAAGISRVVYAVEDPHEHARGGASQLRSVGLQVDHVPSEACLNALSPFLWRCRTGLPWITAKWAQSLDGWIATRSGQSEWISGERSRALVHRERGRVDAILTGIGTIQADDPQLTARGVRRRRVARRLVVDPRAELPTDSALVRTIDAAPVSVLCLPTADAGRVEALRHAGVDVRSCPTRGTQLDLRTALAALDDAYDLSHILVEAGPGLLSSLLDEDLIRACAVFVAPLLLGDTQAIPPVHGESPLRIQDGRALHLMSRHRYGDDTLLRYGVPERPNSTG